MFQKILKSALLVLLFTIAPQFSSAQGSVTLSVSPTLYDMVAEPGQSWQSNLRVINVNDFDLTVYVEVVNFAPRGEGGDGRFIPVLDAERSGNTLAEWITISTEPITVSREQSKEIPFSVLVPNDAPPGGHFAAILVGTRPLTDPTGQSRLQTAQMVTSLFFARVEGDVVESGIIREFSTTKSILGKPEVDFELRFENRGNVHLQPQGEIKIYNMWGEERGIIPINQYSNFGNVLPESIRKFSFTWKGEWSFSDIGRYSAVATLGYGADERQFVDAKTYFWILPLKLIVFILLGLAIFVGIVVWLVRMYVRHTLEMAGIHIENYQALKSKSTKSEVAANQNSLESKDSKMQVLNLRKSLVVTTPFTKRLGVFFALMRQYKSFLAGFVVILIFITVLIWYIASANTEHRAYEVIYTNESAVTAKSSEEIFYDKLRFNQAEEGAQVIEPTFPRLEIVNRSGEPGLGARVRLDLERVGYQVLALKADFTAPQNTTVVVYPSPLYNEALAVSKLLDNALISVSDDVATEQLTIYVGRDIAE